MALGSNKGDRRAHLDYAVTRLRALIDDLQVSPFIETAPVIDPVPAAAGSAPGADPPPVLRHADSSAVAVIDPSRACSSGAAPAGAPPPPDFLNGAAVGRCALEPQALLEALLAIERSRGRVRPYPGAPRTLDLDLIVMGGLVLRRPGIELPHPRFRQRRFVLAPLAAIAPDLVDPVTGRPMRDLLAALDAPRT